MISLPFGFEPSNCLFILSFMVRLSVASLNCRGLNKQTKRRNIFDQCQKYDVSFLQETYITNDKIDIWKNDWQGDIYYFPGTNNSKGIMTMISNNSCVSNCNIFFKSDRILGITCKLDGEEYYLINVYGASSQERKEKQNFINDLYRVFSRINSHNVLVGGDFNMVMDNVLDIIAGNQHDPHIVEAFKSWSLRMNLSDVWRSFNLNSKDFTWSRFNPFCARRLDYVFVNSALLPFIADVKHSYIASSDHKLVSIVLSKNDSERGKAYWKFNNALLEDKVYLEFMNKEIDKFLEEDYDNKVDRFEFFKVMVKSKTIIFSSAKKKQEDNKIVNLTYQINNLNSKIVSDPFDNDSIELLYKTKKELELFEINKARGAMARTKNTEIEKGEKNNSYFLSLEKHRGCQNSINRLSVNSSELTSQEKILVCLKEHFEALAEKNPEVDQDNVTGINNFLKDTEITVLNSIEKEELDQPLTLIEIGKALFDLNNDSTPGLDGISTSWYKVFYNKIRYLLFESYQESLVNEELSLSQRLGVVSLLHKGKELRRDLIKNWRPITITNTDYKILSKCLAKRMQKVLDKIINPNQSGFMKGRNIADHIRLIDDAINLSNKFDTPGLLVSLDFAKAFDSISKASILSALQVFNFGESFIKMVKTLTQSSESCILNMGWMSDFYNTTNTGVKQGCCLSPLLFILTSELLAIRLRKEKNISGLQFSISNFKSEPLKILQYCDDTTLLLSSTEELNVALEIIEDFYKISGLKLNRQKSIGIGLGSSKDIIGNPGNITWKEKGDPIKILGIYFSSEKEASDLDINWVPKIERVLELSGRLYKRKVSLFGRITLCKTYLLSQLSYSLQALSIPHKYAVQLDSLLFHFVWKKHSNKKVVEKIHRDVMCKEKNRGGAGMIRLSSQQKVFLAKWMIKLDKSSKNSQVCISKIPELYFSQFGGVKHFFNFSCPMNDISIPSYLSRFWCDVIKSWLCLKANFKIFQNIDQLKNCSQVINIHNSSLFYNDLIKFRGQSIFFKNWIKLGFKKLGDVIEPDGSFKKWEKWPDEFKGRPEFLFEFNVVKVAVDKLCKEKCKTEITIDMDKISKLSNQVLRNLFDNNVQREICGAQFWKRKFDGDISDLYQCSLKSIKEIKMKVLLFKIFHNILPTRILLKKYNIVNDDKCACGQVDYIEHSLVSCPLLKDLWRTVNQSIIQLLNRILIPELAVRNKLFGVSPENDYGLSKSQIQVINNILIIAKFAIVKARAQNSNNFMLYFEEELNARKTFINM